MPQSKDFRNLVVLKPPRIKKRVNVTIETIMEPEFEREDDDHQANINESRKYSQNDRSS